MTWRTSRFCSRGKCEQWVAHWPPWCRGAEISYEKKKNWLQWKKSNLTNQSTGRLLYLTGCRSSLFGYFRSENVDDRITFPCLQMCKGESGKMKGVINRKVLRYWVATWMQWRQKCGGEQSSSLPKVLGAGGWLGAAGEKVTKVTLPTTFCSCKQQNYSQLQWQQAQSLSSSYQHFTSHIRINEKGRGKKKNWEVTITERTERFYYPHFLLWLPTRTSV